MGKTIFIFHEDDGTPILDSVSATLTAKFSPYTTYGSVLEPVTGNNNGIRVFTDLEEGEYDLKFDSSIQSNLSPLFIAGPVVIPATTIGALSIVTGMLNDDVVTSEKIAEGAVDDAAIAEGAISNLKIATGAVTGSKIADSSVTQLKLASDVFHASMESTTSGYRPKLDNVTVQYNASGAISIGTGGISASMFADGAITEAKIGTGQVTAVRIGSGAVVTSKIGSAAVTTEKIADGAITSAKIGTGAITAVHLSTAIEGSYMNNPTLVVLVAPSWPTGTEGFTTITQALAAIQQNEATILLFPGEYYETFDLNPGISIIGLDRDRTILSPASNSTTAGINITYGDVTIKNVTIWNTGGDPNYSSVGVKINNASTGKVVIEDCTFYVKGTDSYVSPKSGMGIHIYQSQEVLIRRCNIKAVGGNITSGTAANGIGIYVEGNSRTTIDSCQIQGERGIYTVSGNHGLGYGVYYTSTQSLGYIKSSLINASTNTIVGQYFSPYVFQCLLNTSVIVGSQTYFVDNITNSYITMSGIY